MPTTLLTGANGFAGATVLATLLKQNHTVLACVRRLSSVQPLLDLHPDWPSSNLKWIEIPDFTAPDAFDTIFQSHPDLEHVVHVAAPVLDNPANTDFVKHFEQPSVQGNLSLLTAAHRYGRNLRSVAVVGSINAITTGDPADLSSRTLDATQWLPLSRDDAISMQNPYVSYCVAKSLAERAIWSFVETNSPKFTVTNFNPPILLGPPEQAIPSLTSFNWSTGQFYSFLTSSPPSPPSTSSSTSTVPPTTFPAYLDVRDLATLLLLSLTTPAAANKRFLVGRSMSYRLLSDTLREMEGEIPGLERGRVKGQNEEDRPVEARMDTGEVDKVSGPEGFMYKSLEETVRDTAVGILGVERRLGK